MESLESNPRVTYRIATKEDIEAFTGGGVPYTLKALAFFYDGKPAGIGGYKIENGNFVVFSDILKDVDAPKLTIYRCALKIMELIRAKGLPMYVVADNPSLCKRMGFEPYVGSVWKCQV